MLPADRPVKRLRYSMCNVLQQTKYLDFQSPYRKRGAASLLSTCNPNLRPPSSHIESEPISTTQPASRLVGYIERPRCSKALTFSLISNSSILTVNQHGCISKVTINMLSKLLPPLHLQPSSSIITELLPTTTLLPLRLLRLMAKSLSWTMYQRRIAEPWPS